MSAASDAHGERDREAEKFSSLAPLGASKNACWLHTRQIQRKYCEIASGIATYLW
ncbi:predicted protein [Chaetomium globosum CBS 148.51]|uniref:Uncharacterized protein n=1 Tax=Chaetomium globosum (strain ATCC 6205 / CBS 148.51 / DSM 1962 / NBRC 6347 / NRRL 1970) TaxID=306901 RepID=Q2GT40_CHAGB|nr:uncharacterized protein CHGG_08864 [Chaetomium globosum CBS 148.51]EAQ84850.1 predicted protein [Chaetomium globosum CBS 148.51]